MDTEKNKPREKLVAFPYANASNMHSFPPFSIQVVVTCIEKGETPCVHAESN